MTALRIMHRLAGRGLIWNDLVRGTVELLLVRLLTLGRPAIVHHDGIASVAAGFTRHEALDLARRVGLPDIAYRRHLFGRFTLTTDQHEAAIEDSEPGPGTRRAVTRLTQWHIFSTAAAGSGCGRHSTWETRYEATHRCRRSGCRLRTSGSSAGASGQGRLRLRAATRPGGQTQCAR
jgi:hypothetical protein